jgi:predicted SAM-dependent methyltransferase
MNKVLELEIEPRYGSALQRLRGVKRVAARALVHFLPLHTLAHLYSEIPLTIVRLKSSGVVKKYRGAKDLLVNLGPGTQGLPGWINVDVFESPLVNCMYDSRKSLPFPDESVRGIFCEHLFEHIDYTEEVPYFLSECHRVLKKDGVLRLILPDAGKYLQAYCNGGWDELEKIRSLAPGRMDAHTQCKFNTRMELINVVFRQGHQHKFAYDFETLDFLLHRYGFTEVVRKDYGSSLMPELVLDQASRAPESIYVDARK